MNGNKCVMETSNRHAKHFMYTYNIIPTPLGSAEKERRQDWGKRQQDLVDQV